MSLRAMQEHVTQIILRSARCTPGINQSRVQPHVEHVECAVTLLVIG